MRKGFDILRGAGTKELPEDERYDSNFADIAEVWRRGSVICSWLLDLTAMALAEDPKLARFSGPSRIPAKAAGPSWRRSNEAVPADVLSAALYARFRSREHEDSFADKLLSAMRNKFGGHVEPKGGMT